MQPRVCRLLQISVFSDLAIEKLAYSTRKLPSGQASLNYILQNSENHFSKILSFIQPTFSACFVSCNVSLWPSSHHAYSERPVVNTSSFPTLFCVHISLHLLLLPLPHFCLQSKQTSFNFLDSSKHMLAQNVTSSKLQCSPPTPREPKPYTCPMPTATSHPWL